jgi:hypothetical protein
VYFAVNGVRYWALLTPSGLMLYQREGAKSRYLGRRSVAEVKEMLAKAGAEAVQKIKTELETVKQAVESQKPAQTAQTPSLTWKKDGHTYWLLLYAKSVYVYMKGPTTRHKPRLVEKTDVTGVVGRVVAAGAVHVLEALRALVNGLHAAVSDLLRPQRSAAGEAQAPRREAEEAFRRLRGELSRAVERWDEEWRREAEEKGYWGGPDREWLRERLWEFINDNMHLVEKILPHQDLVDEFADAVEKKTYEHITRSDVLEALSQL